jgi:hypothetical protein
MQAALEPVRQNLVIRSFSVMAALLPRAVVPAGVLAMGVQLVVGAIVALPAATALLAPAAAHAQAHHVKPLMIIRFNQPTVRFERPLAAAVARAQAAKPDVHFTLVQFAPIYGDGTTQQQLADRSDQLLQQVRSQIIASGVSSSAIEVARQQSNAITHTEVHILVQ